MPSTSADMTSERPNDALHVKGMARQRAVRIAHCAGAGDQEELGSCR